MMKKIMLMCLGCFLITPLFGKENEEEYLGKRVANEKRVKEIMSALDDVAFYGHLNNIFATYKGGKFKKKAILIAQKNAEHLNKDIQEEVCEMLAKLKKCMNFKAIERTEDFFRNKEMKKCFTACVDFRNEHEIYVRDADGFMRLMKH